MLCSHWREGWAVQMAGTGDTVWDVLWCQEAVQQRLGWHLVCLSIYPEFLPRERQSANYLAKVTFEVDPDWCFIFRLSFSWVNLPGLVRVRSEEGTARAVPRENQFGPCMVATLWPEPCCPSSGG